jgi:hypothetical protein
MKASDGLLPPVFDATPKVLEMEQHLKLHQPWARIVCEGAFPLLVRSLSIRTRGWIGVIATAKWDEWVVIDSEMQRESFPRSALVGAIEIQACERIIVRGKPNDFPHELRKLIAKRYGKAVATFYPGHYLPKPEQRVYFWELASAATAKDPVLLTVTNARGWTHCNVKMEVSELVRLSQVNAKSSPTGNEEE